MRTGSALYRCKSRLRERLNALPAAPGIYRFYDVSGAIVYVGKSVCLRDRVRSYFTGKATTTKLRRIRQEVTELDWCETGSELEALLLESQLVKRHHPRFNVLLRSFFPRPYVRVDLRSPFPRLEITRQPQRDGASYFGPFPNQSALEAAVEALTDALQLRNCDIPAERLLAHGPCYREELGVCSAPCRGNVTAEEYQQAVRNACGAFEGSGERALLAIQQRMERAAERLQFETAARLRDALRSVQAITGRQQALISAVEELSLVAACPSRQAASLCLFVFRSGRLAFQEDVPEAELRCPARRRSWAGRLLAAKGPAPNPEPGIDPTLLDEIQIVTAWMKQRTQEGTYWRIPDEVDPEQQAAELEAWLARQVPEQAWKLAA